MRWSCSDALVQQNWVRFGLVVRWQTRQHFEDEHAQRIPVDRFVVPLLTDDFRREIVRRTAERPGHVRAQLRKPEVSNLDVAVLPEEDVLRLEISIDDIH